MEHEQPAKITDNTNTLVLIDGNAMVHRAFHALPEDLTTKSGEVVNATLGFASMLLRVLTEVRPAYIAVTFDRPSPTFRHLDYKEYKAHRLALPDNMRPQFGRIRQLVSALNIPIYELDGYEADDVLGTLALQATAEDLATTIVTGDMDTLQLVTPTVKVMATRRGLTDIVIYDEAAVETRFGVTPEHIPDWKALTGDTSDNIPGVPGIGEKTATKLLQTYGDLDGVLAHTAELPKRQQQLLTDFADQARKSKWLATIVTDAPVQLDREACRTHDFDREIVLNLFRELEFHSLIERVNRIGPGNETVEHPQPQRMRNGDLVPVDIETALPRMITPLRPRSPVSPAENDDGTAQLAMFDLPPVDDEPEVAPQRTVIGGPPDTTTVVVTDATMLDVLVASLRQVGRFVFDVETDSVDEMTAQVVGISLAAVQGEAYYIPIGHITTPKGEEPGRQLDFALVRDKIGPLLADPTIKKIAHNAKFDMSVLAQHGMEFQGVDFDTMVAAYLIDPGRRGLGLKEQAFEMLGIIMTNIAQLIGTGQKQITMAQAPIRPAADYAGADADMTLRLVAPLTAKLKELDLWELFTTIEMPLVPVLARMERAGILVDPAILSRMAGELAEQIGALEQAIYSAVGHQFNINSVKQLGEVLFGELKLPAGRKTKSGGYSVDADTLENLQGAHPALDNLLEYRSLVKLKSTYVDGLRELINVNDHRIHTSFNQTIASSGRLSSSNPNLQNIPVRTENGRRIRRAFVAAEGCNLLAADYAQIELRILAHITREPALVEAFEADEDIHRVTGSRLYGVPPEEITKDQRRMAKTVTYAIIYGQSPFGLARTAGMPQDEARRFIQTFEESFPRVKEYVRQTIQQVRSEGYIQTLLGRKRFMPGLLNLPVAQRQAAEREAINMPIQGTNADIIKLAMIKLDAALLDLKLQTRMILQVHDELVFDVPDEELDLAASLVRAHMEGALELSVPLKVEVKVGRDWYSAEPVE